MKSEWIIPACTALGVAGAFFMWFIKTVIRAETKTLRETNGGSHLADVPMKVQDIDRRLAELEQNRRQDRVEAVATRQMVQDVRDNQRLIMQWALIEPTKRILVQAEPRERDAG